MTFRPIVIFPTGRDAGPSGQNPIGLSSIHRRALGQDFNIAMMSGPLDNTTRGCETPSRQKNEEETMNIDRRQLALPALAIGLLGIAPAFAAGEEEVVAKSVEAFRAAQVAADAKAFDALCAPELSYSHSDGRVETKAEFIANATNGKSKVLSLAYKDPKIRVVGNVAIVRFHWLGESESVPEGKKSSTNLHILMNWQKQGADWKLLSRASTKL
jgi:ketosteroid isomerase-like protein